MASNRGIGTAGATLGGARVRAGLALALLWGMTLAVVACTAGDVPEAPSDDAELVEGQALFTANCAQCHGPAGGGALGTKLNEGQLLERMPDADEQRELVVAGRNRMPGFDGKLTDAEIDAVVRYTREVIAAQ